MKVLVTGGAGFIGSHLVEALLTDGHTVSVIDDFNDFYDPRIKRRNLQPVLAEIRLHSIDIRDKDAVLDAFSAERPDAVVHLAARAGVRPSIQRPELYLATNINGTFHLLEASKEYRSQTLRFCVEFFRLWCIGSRSIPGRPGSDPDVESVRQHQASG